MTRSQYITQWTNTLATIERKYIKPVVLALKTQTDAVIVDLRTGGAEYATRRLSSLQFSGPMSAIIQRTHREVGLMMALRTQRELRKTPVKAKATVEDFVQFLTEFFRLYNLDMVSKISDTTRDHIILILEQGTEQGWSIDEMAKRINNQDYLAHRAATIVRTESVRAANYGVQVAAEQYEYETVKEWVAIRDDRTRHSHRTLNGVQRELDEPFKQGLRFPGDPDAPPGETVNCRCVMIIKAKRDSNGLLIPRTNVVRLGSFAQSA